MDSKVGVAYTGLRSGGTGTAELPGAGAAEVGDDPAELLGTLSESLTGQ